MLAIVSLAGCGISYNTLPLTVSPNSVSFGAVAVGKTQTATIKLANAGMKPVTLSGVQSADAAFAVDSSNAQTTVPAGGTASVQVTFKPTEAKSYSSQVVVLSGSAQTTVAVSGAGQKESNPAPPTTPPPASPALQVSANSLQFGSVPIGGNAQQSLSLTSSGSAPLHISTLHTAGAGFSAQAPSMPLTLQPGQVLTVPVKFVPAASGAAAGNLVIQSNAANTPSVTVNLAGSGTSSTPVPPTPETPALTLSSTAVDFGSVALGSRGSDSVTLTSSGTASVVVQSMDVSGADFSAGQVQLPLTLAPGQQVTLPLSFAPTSAGSEQGKITLTDNATGSANVIRLTGKGTTVPPVQDTPALALSSTAVDFGSVAMGSKGTDSVTLTSSGTASVVVQAINVSGGDFSTGHVQLPLTLAPGKQVTLPLTYAPTKAGAEQGKITLTDNATGSPNVISLSGKGTAVPSASLSVPESVEFGDVTVGSQGAKTITLVSNGTAPVTINSIDLSGASFSKAPSALPQVLQPNQQMSLKLKFSPQAAGDTTGSVTITSNATGSSKTTVHVHGKGVPTSSPSLSASATSLSFGSVQVGSDASKVLTVKSTGTAPATISAGSITGAFTATLAGVPVQNLSSPVVLQPGQQVSFNVSFSPTAIGTSKGQLSFATDTSSPLGVSLSGSGIQATSPALSLSATSLDFGGVQVGSTSKHQLTLSSSGTAPVTISSGAIAGQDFQIASVAWPSGVNNWPVTLNPGQQIVMTVVFAPDAVNSFSGNLALTSDASGSTANVPLSGTGDAVPVANLTLSSNSINFGQTTVGSKVTRTVTVTSTGTAALNINTIDVSGAQFTVAPQSLPVALQPNQQLSLTVTYEPTAAGNDTGTLTIGSDDPSGPATVSLGGSGTSTTTPQLTVSPTSVSFGNVPLNTPSSKSITITSSGSAAVTISSATVTGADFKVSGASFPLTLNPSQSATLTVQFTPTVTSAESGQLTLTSDSSSGGTTQIALSGTGTAPTTPQLTVSPTSVSFGSVPLNTPSTKSITLTSSGSAAVTISSATVTGADFKVSGGSFPLTLNPSQSATLTVQFTPTVTSAESGQLTLTSNSSSGGTMQIALSGTGTAPTTSQLTVNPTSVSFGSVPLNTPSTKSITITSSGSAAVTISSATVTGADFKVSGASFPLTLNPSQSATLTVQFTPTVTSAESGQLTLTSNSSSGGTTQIALSGTGTAPTTSQLTVSTSSLSFGNVTVNSSATLPVTLTSSGTAPVTISAVSVSGTGFADSGASFPVTLNPNQSVTLNVQFGPTATGSVTGQLTITSNSSTNATAQIQLSGSGTAVQTAQLLVSATSLNFGDVPVNSTATLNLTLTSSGTAPVTVSSVGVKGTGFSDSGASFPITLNPNQSVTLQVQFDPTAAGSVTGQLTITSNASSGATAQVALSGNGAAVQHQVDLSWNAPSSSSDPVAGYNVYRSSDGGGSFTKINSSPETNVTYTDNNVQSGTSYMYEVKSVDASGVESGPSNQITLTVP